MNEAWQQSAVALPLDGFCEITFTQWTEVNVNPLKSCSLWACSGIGNQAVNNFYNVFFLEEECVSIPRIRSLSGSQKVCTGTPPQGEDGT